MKRMRNRLTALLLVLAMMCSFMVTASAADYWWSDYVTNPETDYSITTTGKVESEGKYLLLTSDVHRYPYLAKDLLDAANEFITGDGKVGLVAFGGDFANEYTLYADNMTILKHAIGDTPATYTKGNHEGDVTDEEFVRLTGMSRIGEVATNKDGLYHIFNFGSPASNQEFLEADIATLKTYLDGLEDEKPVFIVSHYPLHYYNVRRNSANADKIVALLNEHPQVVFLWAHNHTEQDPNYGMIRLPGDTIQTGAKADSSVEIKFTYACLGALRDGVNGASGVLAEVNGTAVTFKYINIANTTSDDTWTDAQGNENAVRVAGTPVVSSETVVETAVDQSVIKLANIQLDRPLVDKVPDTSAAEYSDRFSAGEVSWGDVEKYDFGTEYTATFTLTAADGYKFAEDANVYVNLEYVGPMPGQKHEVAEADVTVSSDGKTAAVSYKFPATAAKGVEVSPVTTIENGGQYVLASEDNYAASYEFDPAQHGEESMPDYTVEGADVVLQGGKLVSATDKWMTFTAQKDAHGYLLYSDESFLSYGQIYEDAEVINYMDISTRGGELGIQANNMSSEAIYSNWNVDESGNVYVSIDGIAHYPVSKEGKFSLSTNVADTNVKLFKVGTDDSYTIYTATVNLPAPAAGAAPAVVKDITDEYYGYTVSQVTWDAGETFDYNTPYTATVTLAAKEGFTFSKEPITGRVSGHVASKTEVGADGKTATVTYTFAATGAKPGAVVEVDTVKVDELKAGGKYIIVGADKALTYNYVDGIFMKATAVTVANGKITSQITEDMILTAEEGTDGVALTYGGKYMDAKPVDNSPDTWGFTDATDAKSAIGFAYKDGLLTVASTGAAAGGPGGPGGPGGGPGAPPPPPGGATSALYFSNGHFNYGTIASTAVTIYKVVEVEFDDVPEGKWYSDAVAWATDEGITNGIGNNKFAPTRELTRAEIVTMIWRSQGKPSPASEEIPFEDIKADKWYTDAAIWAVEQGIIKGTGKGFEPDSSCSRAEIVTMLYRLAEEPAVTEKAGFTDVPEGKWYSDAVAWAVKEGVTTGMTNTTFEPNTVCNRAQAVTFLFRMK